MNPPFIMPSTPDEGLVAAPLTVAVSETEGHLFQDVML